MAGGNGLPWALPAREGTAHLVIVPRPLARTLTSVGSDLSGRRGEPPSGAGARARGLSIRVPHVAVTLGHNSTSQSKHTASSFSVFYVYFPLVIPIHDQRILRESRKESHCKF